MKRKSKLDYFRKLVISNTDSRQIWKAINLLCNKHVSKSQKIIKDISADELNNHFSIYACQNVIFNRSET